MPDNNTIARAYVQLVASADGMSDSVKKAMGEAGEEGGKSFSSGFGGFLKGAGSVIGSVVSSAASGVASMTKEAVNAFADFEQLSGGVETLFGAGGSSITEYADSVGKSVQEVASEYASMMEAQNMVMRNSETAFKTSGLSQNDYMETVTGFSASLIGSLEGDTVKAASVADMAIIDMSDNANKMGTSIESIQNAYSGFAKGNFTMLDNLKLGYGGTKSEMERLLQDATAISGVEYDLDSFADISEAIHVIQSDLGITGTTAEEASSTISGSIGQMQGAWTNLVAGLAKPDADLSSLIDDLIGSVTTVIGNLTPAIQQALIDITGLVREIVPIIIELLPGIVEEVLPPLLSAVAELAEGLVGALPSLVGLIVKEIPNLFWKVIAVLTSTLPELVMVAFEAIETLALGIGEALPKLIPQLVHTILFIVQQLISPESIKNILGAALALIVGLAEGIISAIPEILKVIPTLISSIVVGLVEFVPQIAMAGIELITALLLNLPEIIGSLIEILPNIIIALKDTFTSEDFKNQMADAGVMLMEGLANGLGNAVSKAVEKAKEVASRVVNTVKDAFGIKSPSRVFAQFGEYLDEGLANGIERNLGVVDGAMGEMVDSVNFGAELNPSFESGVVPSAFQIVVNAAEGQSAEEVAERVSEIIANRYYRERRVMA